VSHGVNRGILKKNKIDERFKFMKELTIKGHHLDFKIFGLHVGNVFWRQQMIIRVNGIRFYKFGESQC
jgi:hypothetical protein